MIDCCCQVTVILLASFSGPLSSSPLTVSFLEARALRLAIARQEDIFRGFRPPTPSAPIPNECSDLSEDLINHFAAKSLTAKERPLPRIPSRRIRESFCKAKSIGLTDDFRRQQARGRVVSTENLHATLS